MNLEDKIQDEMTTDKEDVLEKYFDRVIEAVELSENGRVFLKPDQDFSTKEEILLYGVGKHYASKAGYTDDATFKNKELVEQLERPKGTIEWGINELKDAGKIKRKKDGEHKISTNRVGKTLDELGV